MEKCRAYLIQIGPTKSKLKQMEIRSTEFRIGRSKKADLCLADLSVSRSHCVICCSNSEWWLTNESQLGTLVSDKLVAANEKCALFNENIIQLGPESVYRYKFCIGSYKDEPPEKCAKMEVSLSEVKSDKVDINDAENKKIAEEEIKLKKQNEDLNYQLQKIMQEKEEVRFKYEEEKKKMENELLTEKIALEQRLKEMEEMLTSKEKEQQTLSEKLRQTDEENVKLVALRHEATLKAESMIASLRNEVLEKELIMRETLELEMKNLLDSRMHIEESIRVEKEQTEGACAEKLKVLEEELFRVKQDLVSTKGKQSLLEKELEEAESEKEKGTRTSLIAKREALSEFSDLIEMELQCSICSELFVKAITLSCTHTVCHYCLQEWKKKKRNCPMCRAPIVTENHSIVLDNFIDKIVENLSEEMKKRRLEIIEERKALEILSKKPSKKKKKKTTVNNPPARNAGHGMAVHPSTSNQGDVPEVIVIGEEDGGRVPNPQQAQPNHLFRGACFACGERGHWAYACPYTMGF